MDARTIELQSAEESVVEEWEFKEKKILRWSEAGKFSAHSIAADISSDLTQASDEKLQDEWDRVFLRSSNVIQYSGGNGTAGLVDLFSGCGGFSLGVSIAARALGLTPVHSLAVDVDESALSVYRRNFAPRDSIRKSVADLIDYRIGVRGSRVDFSYPPEILNETLASWKGRVTAVIGGPPCQGYSNFNNRSRRNDPRNTLYLTIPAIAIALNAPLVLIENVPDVVNDKSDVVTRATRVLESEGYAVTHCILSAAELGLPQTRRRHILVASKVRRPIIETVKVALARTPRDVKWAIGDLCTSDDPRDFFNCPADLSEENRARIDHLFDESIYDLPNHVRPDCHKDGHTYPSVYGRLNWEKPAGTITTGFLSPGRGRFIHPSERRGLTPHEAARLQGFPDNFRFLDEQGQFLLRKQYAKLIGDAVPPVIGYVAGLAAFGALEKRDLKS